jgi:hypothetical protein
MKKFLIVAILLGAGGVFAWKHFMRSEARSCAKLADLCGDKAKDMDKCVSDMADLRKQLGDDVANKFDSCVADAKTCAEGAGCMVGAGMSGVGDAVNQFMKGMGKALNK